MTNNKAFTLIETLIYSAIVTMILSFVLLVAYQLISSEDRVIQLREVTENQKFILQKFFWVLQSVNTINSPASGGSGASLSVNKINYIYNPLIIYASNGVVYLNSGATSTPITNSFVNVSALNFQHLILSGHSAIKVTATLGNKVATATIDTTIIVK